MDPFPQRLVHQGVLSWEGQRRLGTRRTRLSLTCMDSLPGSGQSHQHTRNCSSGRLYLDTVSTLPLSSRSYLFHRCSFGVMTQTMYVQGPHKSRCNCPPADSFEPTTIARPLPVNSTAPFTVKEGRSCNRAPVGWNFRSPLQDVCVTLTQAPGVH